VHWFARKLAHVLASLRSARDSHAAVPIGSLASSLTFTPSSR
jgi:hypothetical protein